MKDGDRRDLLRSLNEVEYQNVMNVCASYPNVKMEVRSEGRCETDFIKNVV